jgi:hypothetical protein
VCALALSACNSKVGDDGYVFERMEWDKNMVESTVYYASYPALRAAAPREAIHADRDLMGFSIISGNRCQIHVVHPNVERSRIWIGHEKLHCRHGRWHD